MALVGLLGCATGCASTSSQAPAAGAPTASNALFEPNPAPETIKVKLPSLQGDRIPNDFVFSGFGCSGKNVSLPVTWEGVPENTKSIAVVMHDPDAPTGVGFFHWSVFNLPKETTSLASGASGSALPSGAVEGYTDFGKSGYGGPCPPPGTPHRYIVTVYALDIPKIDAGPGATGALLRFSMNGHTLALGRATGLYGR